MADDNLTYLTPRNTANTPISSPSPATMAPTTTPMTPEGTYPGAQPIGALLPDWLAKFTATSALHAQRMQAARDAFLAAGGACWDCRDTGYVGAILPDETETTGVGCEHCAAGQAIIADQRAALVAQALELSGVPCRLAQCAFGTFPPASRRRIAQTQRFAEAWDWRSGRGLLLFGEPSVGKTGLVVSALRTVLARWANETPVADLRSSRALPRRRRVWFTTDVALLDTLRAGYEDNTAQTLIRQAKTVALLVIDDLGKADLKGGAGWGVERLYDIIDARYSALLPTWFTTNLGADQLRKRLGEDGEAIMDRLLDACEAITIKGTKLRMGVSA